MAYHTLRVEITCDKTRDGGPISIEITAYIDRMPETNDATIGCLSRGMAGAFALRSRRQVGWESTLTTR
jgi:hypothetical protein